MTIAIDSSTPAIVGRAGTTTPAGPTFSPPANALVLLGVATVANVTVASITDNLGSHLNWTKLGTHLGPVTDNEVEWWAADSGSSAPGSVTPTVTLSASAAVVIGCPVLTGAQPVASQTGTPVGGDSFGSLSSLSLTTTAAGSWVFGVFANRTGAPTAGSGQTLTFPGATSQSLALPGTGGDFGWLQTTTTAAGASGTVVTISDTAPSGEWSGLLVEVLAATGGAAAPTPPAIVVPSVAAMGSQSWW